MIDKPENRKSIYRVLRDYACKKKKNNKKEYPSSQKLQEKKEKRVITIDSREIQPDEARNLNKKV